MSAISDFVSSMVNRVSSMAPNGHPVPAVKKLRDMMELKFPDETCRDMVSALDEFYRQTGSAEFTGRLAEDITANYTNLKAEKDRTAEDNNFNRLTFEDYFAAVSGRIRSSLAAHADKDAGERLAEIVEDKVTDFTSLVYIGMANTGLPLGWAANTADNASVLYTEFDDKEKFIENMGKILSCGRSHPLEISVTEAMGSWCEGDKEKEKRFISCTARALKDEIGLDLAMGIAGEMLDKDDSMYGQAKKDVLLDNANMAYVRKEIEINHEHGFMSGNYPLVMTEKEMEDMLEPFRRSMEKFKDYSGECMAWARDITDSAHRGNKEYIQTLGEQHGVFPTQQEVDKIRCWQKERKRENIIKDMKQILISWVDDVTFELHEAYDKRGLDDYFGSSR